MPELTLQDLVNKSQIPSITETNEELNKGIKYELTEAQKQEVAKIKDNIDLTSTESVLQYGASAQKTLTSFSDNILSQVKTKDADEIGKMLMELSGEISNYNKNDFVSKIPIFGKLVDKTKQYVSKYETVEKKVNGITQNLNNARMELAKDIETFNTMYAQNVEYFHALTMYIDAGYEKLQEAREVTLPKLIKEAEDSNSPIAVQVVNDFEKRLDTFEKRLIDLQISRTICIQTAPQIRIIQANDEMLVEKIQNAIYNAIPIWKNQLVIALGLQKQEKVLQLHSAMSEMTNKMLLDNAKKLKMGSVNIAKESNKATISIETVEKVNKELIETINETIRIQKEGKVNRAQIEEKLASLEEEIKLSLQQAV